MHLKTFLIACLAFSITVWGNAQTTHHLYAIAGQPDSVFDYELPVTNNSNYTAHSIEGRMRFTHGENGFWDGGTYLSWFDLESVSDPQILRFAAIAQGTECNNPGPRGFYLGDTIDASHYNWSSAIMELSNPGGYNCTFGPGADYFGVRFIYPDSSGNSDTVYGYWDKANGWRIHMAMPP